MESVFRVTQWRLYLETRDLGTHFTGDVMCTGPGLDNVSPVHVTVHRDII